MLFRSITWLSNPLVLTGLGVIVAMVLLVQRHWMSLIAWTGALAGGGLLNVILKVAIERGRPELAAAMYAEGWSFRSGHAMGATTAFSMLAYLAASRFRAYFSPIIVVAILLILLIGASRIYLGVHYLSDVVGGFLAGTIWLMICITACEFAGAHTVKSQMKAKR